MGRYWFAGVLLTVLAASVEHAQPPESAQNEPIGPAQAQTAGKIYDLKGRYVLPGLIDAHTHAADFASFRRALESGVTTVRSAGVSNYVDVGFHELVKKGAVTGPDVVTAGYHVRPQLAPEAFLNNPQYADLMSGVTTIE